VRLAGRYRAAGEGNEVGGDFYDVFQVGRNAWTLVLGDVSGKGPEAAAIAGFARHTLRALAMKQRTPRRLLASLHETLVQGEGQGEFCTVCCGLLQPNLQPERGARLSIACAGHPPPVIRRADGSVELTSCTGPLLGVPLRNVSFRQQVVDLLPGDIVVMYTDGVTEAHHRGQELFGEERLMEIVASAPPDIDALADQIVEGVITYGPSEPRDDLALIVVQIEGMEST
jgi:serine phosphatase RsbU (regulator of sigma subunit)